MTFSNIVPCDSGVYKNNLNGEVNPTYILNSLTYDDNEADPNPETCPYYIFSASPMSLGEHNVNVYDSDDSYNVKEVTSNSHESAKIH